MIDKLLIVKAADPLLATVNVCGALVVFRTWLPKLRLTGEILPVGPPVGPCPTTAAAQPVKPAMHKNQSNAPFFNPIRLISRWLDVSFNFRPSIVLGSFSISVFTYLSFIPDGQCEHQFFSHFFILEQGPNLCTARPALSGFVG